MPTTALDGDDAPRCESASGQYGFDEPADVARPRGPWVHVAEDHLAAIDPHVR